MTKKMGLALPHIPIMQLDTHFALKSLNHEYVAFKIC